MIINIKRFLLLVTIVLILFVPTMSWESISTVNADSNQTIYLPSIRSTCVNKIAFQRSASETIESETIRLINTRRAANGRLAPLVMNDSLVQIARYHSLDMAASGVTTHNGSAGETPWSRFDWSCQAFGSLKGEIIGWGFGGDPARMVDWWMNSPGHRDLILNSGFALSGVGYAYLSGSQWGHYLTVDFTIFPSKAAEGMLAANSSGCTTTTKTSPEGGASFILCQ